MLCMLDRTDKAITPTMCGFNETWRFWIVAESLSYLTNSNFEDAFGYKGSWPRSVEFFFCDESAPMPKKIVEDCKSFGSEFYCVGASPQTLVRQVQAKRIESYTFFVAHGLTKHYRNVTAGL